MSDAMLMIYLMWVLYGVAIFIKPETFTPLMWAIGIATIFLTLFGMFVESAHSAQEYRLKELSSKENIERYKVQAAQDVEYRKWQTEHHPDYNNGSTFLDKPGYRR